ncbi:phosphate transport system regulatory protein PhoU [Candidatus Vecturithrix granuli]|uniref:Phosphate-specific transport system accessory protein PhoU n=1 Tax=Vecturithrix granuli TaxID=1499967 RepID=A0A081BXX9_VECG1|nr:phosphate transport system regulatory protein PhoU [Candidatus Vecturithrix granuli]
MDCGGKHQFVSRHSEPGEYFMILHKEIGKLKQQLLALGALVEERLNKSVKAVDKRDLELAQQIIEGDCEVDALEVDLEEDCLKVLALHQPVAIDLRLIMAVMKINIDLERIGDLAVDIADRARYFATHEEVTLPFDFLGMSRKAQDMLQKSLDALVNLDIELARKVCAADDAVDDMHSSMFQKVEQAIQAQPQYVEQFISYLSVSRYLERIADHATNIAEDVIYLVEGQIVRHSGGMY